MLKLFPCWNRTSTRGAFTLVELLVVIAIIGILVALLLPAVQAAREAARNTECKNKIRQLVLAVMNFESANGRFPNGASYFGAPKSTVGSSSNLDTARFRPRAGIWPGPNWGVMILDYLEDSAVKDSVDTEAYFSSGGTDRSWQAVREIRIASYLCPSDAGNDEPWRDREGNFWQRGNYAANAGPAWFNWSAGGTRQPGMDPSLPGVEPPRNDCWNFMEVDDNGRPLPAPCGDAVPVMSTNFGTTIQRITDGTTKTVMFAEVRAGVNERDQRGVWGVGQPGSSILAAAAIFDAITPNDREGGADDIETCRDIGLSEEELADLGMGCSIQSGNWQAQSRSLHTAGVNIGFCDGSTRSVLDNIDNQVWFNILSAADGNSRNDF